MTSHSTPLADWRPARKFPHTYPGDRPPQAYLLLDDTVHLISFNRATELGSAVIQTGDGSSRSVDGILADLGLPGIEDRYPIVAYGANRNPATLAIKFRNYGCSAEGEGLAVPVLRGTLTGCDMVAGGISGQGYCYGDLLFDSPWTKETRVEAWLTLLDRDQLRAINESEGVGDESGNYSLAHFPGYRINGWERAIAPLGYAGTAEVFVSPRLGTPMAFSTVEASGRDIFAAEPLEMWDHLLDVYDLRAEIAHLAGIADDADLSRSLSAYMNRHWWRVFADADEPAPDFSRTLGLLKDVFHRDARELSTAHSFGEKGLILDTATAYAPGVDRTLRGIIGM